MTDKELEAFYVECESKAAVMLKELLERFISNGNKDFKVGIKVEADYKDWENYFSKGSSESFDLLSEIRHEPPACCGSDNHILNQEELNSWRECMKTWQLNRLHRLAGNDCEGKKVLCMNCTIGLRTLSLEWLFWILAGVAQGVPKNYKFIGIDSPVETYPLSMKDIIVYDDASRMFKLKEEK